MSTPQPRLTREELLTAIYELPGNNNRILQIVDNVAALKAERDALREDLNDLRIKVKRLEDERDQWMEEQAKYNLRITARLEELEAERDALQGAGADT